MMDITNAIEGRSTGELQKCIIVCLAVTFVFWYGKYLWGRRFLYIHSWSVEGPLALPFIGCGYLFLGKGVQGNLDILMKVQERCTKGLVKLWIGPKLRYSVSKPEYIEKILNHPKALGKDELYRYLADHIGYGLLTAPVKQWKIHKKQIAPSFNQKILDGFVEVFAEKGAILAEKLETVVGQKDFDVYTFISKCTFDIVVETSMGVNMDMQKIEEDYNALLTKCMELCSIRLFNVWYHWDLMWNFSTFSRDLIKARNILHDFCDTIMSKKVEAHEKQMALQQSPIEEEIEEEPVRKRLGFLDSMMNNSRFTETEIKDEVRIFMGAGADTTASSMCFLFIIFGMYPEIQQKVYEEVIDILGPDRSVEASDLPTMKYTERVIKENLRIFPLAPIISRSIEEDIDLGDVIVPAGSATFINAIHVHRSPKYWTDPLKFDPDRFLPEEVAKRHPCTFIPFSVGPRNCIGWSYGIRSMKTLIAILIRKYRIFTDCKSVEEIDLKFIPLLKAINYPRVWIEYR